MFKSNLPSVLTLDSTTLTISSKITSLGVTLDSNLNFSHFVSRTIQTSSFYIQAIKQAGNLFSTYCCYSHSLSGHLKLGLLQLSSLWSSSLHIFKLKFLQNRAAEIVLQADFFSSSRACLDRLHWLLVAQRYYFRLMWLVANILTTGQPVYSHDLLFV